MAMHIPMVKDKGLCVQKSYKLIIFKKLNSLTREMHHHLKAHEKDCNSSGIFPRVGTLSVTVVVDLPAAKPLLDCGNLAAIAELIAFGIFLSASSLAANFFSNSSICLRKASHSFTISVMTLWYWND
uniref:Uncharacterized protein n=1 Tax=Romanomermis culicivorax TaxID=13658 RepID=A0A915IW74_ROMCU